VQWDLKRMEIRRYQELYEDDEDGIEKAILERVNDKTWTMVKKSGRR
jgi:hypothetical protein